MKKRNLPITLSLIFLSLLIAAIGVNFLYINNVGNALTELTLSVSDAASAQELRSFWEAHVNLVSITVSNIATERLTDTIDSIVAYAETDCKEELTASISLTLNAIDGIRKLERISVRNIF